MLLKSGRGPLTLNSDGLLSLLRISKLNADLNGACVLPVRNLILETSKAQNSLGKTQRSVILQNIIPLAISLK